MYTAEAIRRHQEIRLTHGGLILIAIFTSGDYYPGGLPGCGPETAHGLALCGYGDDLLSAAEVMNDDDLSDFLCGWRERIRQELRSNESGYLPRKGTRIASDLTNYFPSVDLVRCYTHPVTSETHPPVIPTLLNWTSTIDVGGLARICERSFEWGYKDSIISTFQSSLHPPLAIRILQQAALDRDVGRPHGDLARLSETVFLSIQSQRQDPSTDRLLEYNVNISHAVLDVLATAGIQGLRRAPSAVQNAFRIPFGWKRFSNAVPSTTTNRGARRASSVEVWVPASMLVRVRPDLVQAYETQQRREQVRRERRSIRVSGKIGATNRPSTSSHPFPSSTPAVSPDLSASSSTTPSMRQPATIKTLFSAAKKIPSTRRRKSKTIGTNDQRTPHKKQRAAQSASRTMNQAVALQPLYVADYVSSGDDSDITLPRRPFLSALSPESRSSAQRYGMKSCLPPCHKLIIEISIIHWQIYRNPAKHHRLPSLSDGRPTAVALASFRCRIRLPRRHVV